MFQQLCSACQGGYRQEVALPVAGITAEGRGSVAMVTHVRRGWGGQELGLRSGVGGAYLSERGLGDAVQLGRALVSQVGKDVEGAHRLRAPLLVAENKVDPLMQLT